MRAELIKLWLGLVALIGLNACSVFRASELPTSHFIPFPEKLHEMHERAPFQKAAIFDPARFRVLKAEYRALYVAPVNTEIYEEKMQSDDLPESYVKRRTEEAHEMARYMRNKFIAAVRDHPDHPLMIAESPGPQTFVLELAIVDLVPTGAVINSVGTVAGFFVPGSGLVRLAGTGSVAMEGVIRDGGSGEPLAEFKDRQRDKTSPFSVKDFQEYSHTRQAIDEWARQYAELSATPLEHRVEGSLPVTLNPF